MAETKTDGGPAFPRPASEYTEMGTLRDGNIAVRQQSGMTLRDYFAAKALTGLMNDGWQQDGNPFNEDRANRTAKIAYEFADAMLKARG